MGFFPVLMLCMFNTHIHTHLMRFVSAGYRVCIPVHSATAADQSSKVCVCVFPMQAACALTAVNTLADPAAINLCHSPTGLTVSTVVGYSFYFWTSAFFPFYNKSSWWIHGFLCTSRQIDTLDLKAGNEKKGTLWPPVVDHHNPPKKINYQKSTHSCFSLQKSSQFMFFLSRWRC